MKEALSLVVPGRFDLEVFYNKTKQSFTIGVMEDHQMTQQFSAKKVVLPNNSIMTVDKDGRSKVRCFGSIYKNNFIEDQMEILIGY